MCVVLRNDNREVSVRFTSSSVNSDDDSLSLFFVYMDSNYDEILHTLGDIYVEEKRIFVIFEIFQDDIESIKIAPYNCRVIVLKNTQQRSYANK